MDTEAEQLRAEIAAVYKERQDVLRYHATAQQGSALELEALSGSGLTEADIQAKITSLTNAIVAEETANANKRYESLSEPERLVLEKNELRLHNTEKARVVEDLERRVLEAMERSARARSRADKVAAAIEELHNIVSTSKLTHQDAVAQLNAEADDAKDAIAAALEAEARKTAIEWDDATAKALAQVAAGYRAQLDADAAASDAELGHYANAARGLAKEVADALADEASNEYRRKIQPLVTRLEARATANRAALAQLFAIRDYLSHLAIEIAAGRDPGTDLAEFVSSCVTLPAAAGPADGESSDASSSSSAAAAVGSSPKRSSAPRSPPSSPSRRTASAASASGSPTRPGATGGSASSTPARRRPGSVSPARTAAAAPASAASPANSSSSQQPVVKFVASLPDSPPLAPASGAAAAAASSSTSAEQVATPAELQAQAAAKAAEALAPLKRLEADLEPRDAAVMSLTVEQARAELKATVELVASKWAGLSRSIDADVADDPDSDDLRPLLAFLKECQLSVALRPRPSAAAASSAAAATQARTALVAYFKGRARGVAGVVPAAPAPATDSGSSASAAAASESNAIDLAEEYRRLTIVQR